MSEDELKDQKEVAFYSALVNAWINTKMERDKTLLILSSGGIGILVTLLSTQGVVNCLGVVFYVLAFIAFLSCMIILVIVFDKNSKHIEEAIKGKKDSDPKLDLLDKISLWSFILGALFSIVIGLNTAVYIQNKKGVEEMGKSNPIQSVKGKEITKSLSGVGGLAPEKPTDSVSGVGKISPQSGSQTTKTTNNKSTKK
jgi:preprotein translocase subunit SecG